MNNKSSHLGECQICGSRQCLPNGRLAKHGYSVEWGFFSGVCHGAGYLPFEQEKAELERVVRSIEKQVVACSARIAELNDGLQGFDSHVARYARSLAAENSSRRDWLALQYSRISGWAPRPLVARVEEQAVKVAKQGVRKAAQKLNDDIYRAKRSFEKLLDEKNRVLLAIRGEDYDGMGRNDAWLDLYYAHPTSNRGASLRKQLAAFESVYPRNEALYQLIENAVKASELVVSLKAQK